MVLAILSGLVVVVAGAGYALFSGSVGPGTSIVSVVTRCSPPSSPACAGLVPGHDLRVQVPFSTVATETSVPVTASLPATVHASTYSFDFGDGAQTVSTQPTTDHTFATPGRYLIYVNANLSVGSDDNAYRLVTVEVAPSFYVASRDNVPSVQATLVSNSTSRTNATGILVPGEAITVTGVYASTPSDPGFTEVPPSIVAPEGGDILDTSYTATSARATVGFSAAGTYTVVFAGGSVNESTGAHAYANYTWSVFVAEGGEHAGAVGPPTSIAGPPRTLQAYEYAPGGAASLDPAIDYEGTGEETILNVYQTLIAPNGSRTGPDASDFVPILATCVPGSAQCEQLYGSSLVNGANYTFVLQGNASFFDPLTHARWGVWPTDVLFSVARTLAFSTVPFPQWNNGWILAQALLGTGNGSWDPLHAPYNSTPQEILGSMTLNESGVCTVAMQSPPNHGCVTFHAGGGGRTWPYFLELISDPLGGSVVPCGWFSAPAQSAGIPYWTRGNVSGSGDEPCAAPGAPGYGLAGTDPSLPATGWDDYEILGSGAIGTYLGSVQFAMAGSGPYYLSSFLVASAYTLSANPVYESNPFCTWSGCPPSAGAYQAEVDVTWETSPATGETALLAGIASYATIPPTDGALIGQLVRNGTAVALAFPTLTVGLLAFNLDVLTGASPPSGTSPLIGDALGYVGLRQFLAHAYPYTSIAQTYETSGGIEYAIPLGGVIPRYLGSFAPTNLSWPAGDPDPNPSDVGGAAWWWAQTATNSSSPYYDPNLAGCTSASPCALPLNGPQGIPYSPAALGAWAAEVSTLSGGRLVLTAPPIVFAPRPGTTPMAGGLGSTYAAFGVGWVPDYADPSDYTDVLYAPTGIFPTLDGLATTFAEPTFNGTGCHSATDAGWWAHTATTVGVTTACENAAYSAMVLLLATAGSLVPGAQRALLYTMAEGIASALALYISAGQGMVVDAYAPWIDLGSVNVNPLVGGGGIHPWYALESVGAA